MFHTPAHKQSAALVTERAFAAIPVVQIETKTVTRGTIFELLGDDRIEFGEDQGDHEYVRDETGFAIHASGHYTVEELEMLVRALKEANRRFRPKLPADAQAVEFREYGDRYRFDPASNEITLIKSGCSMPFSQWSHCIRDAACIAARRATRVAA